MNFPEFLAVFLVVAVVLALMAGYPVALTLAGISLGFAVFGVLVLLWLGLRWLARSWEPIDDDQLHERLAGAADLKRMPGLWLRMLGWFGGVAYDGRGWGAVAATIVALVVIAAALAAKLLPED